jgi:uncharacterized lipoprotein YddW (UPF0748 family)
VLAEGTERPLEDAAEPAALVETAVRLGATDLFVQVYRAGRSWFASRNADDTPARGLPQIDGDDSLRALVALAHARGLRVHGWFNALSLATNGAAPLIARVGRAAVHVDRKGRSLLDYPGFDVPPPDRRYLQLGTPGIWLDPATPGVIEALEAVADDLVAAAPDLDGLHLDFIRHPYALPIVPGSRFEGLDFGYGEASVAAFERASGRAFERGEAWDDFRRAQVGAVVRRVCARLPERAECSAAVLPWADRAYLAAMQDYRGWLEDGALDFAVAMAYMRDDRLLRYVSRALVGGVGGDRVWIGLGTWLLADTPERAAAQARLALEAGPAGIAYFSWDALAPRADTQAALVGALR